MRAPDAQDLGSGALFTALGAAGYWLTLELPVGSALSMGSGFVPRGIALILVGLGLVISGRAFAVRVAQAPVFFIRPMLFVFAALLFFAAAIGPLGLALTVPIAVVLAGLASRESRPREVAVLAILLSAALVLVFVVGLKLPVPVWPQWSS